MAKLLLILFFGALALGSAQAQTDTPACLTLMDTGEDRLIYYAEMREKAPYVDGTGVKVEGEMAHVLVLNDEQAQRIQERSVCQASNVTPHGAEIIGDESNPENSEVSDKSMLNHIVAAVLWFATAAVLAF